METAKVDVRKLELLCERVNQTIEALNQVRLSIHGYQPQGYNQAYGPASIAPMAYGQIPGLTPFGFAGIPPFAQQSWGLPPFAQPFGMQSSPFYGSQTENEPWARTNDVNRMGRFAQVFPNAFAATGV